MILQNFNYCFRKTIQSWEYEGIQYIPNVQLITNSTFARSAKYTPFVLMIRVNMKNNDYLKIKDMFDEKYVIYRMKDMREEAERDILQIQQESKRQFNKARKE